ncbi:Golgi integral membrane protein 4 isoform X6 [Tursiops truncatus]|uniref:Golgi integral membrane protein 4 isoform X1 n=1 Tax=Tursiops truncatus TaxID=9739 RepID=A0A2U4C8K2_TURTR|nr:Golgi integral membrane protein 4 isoform X1 [Tursiops truncatus]
MGNGMCSRKQKRIFQTLLLLTVVFGFLYGAMLYYELQTQLRKAEAVALKYQQHQESLSAQLQELRVFPDGDAAGLENWPPWGPLPSPTTSHLRVLGRCCWLLTPPLAASPLQLSTVTSMFTVSLSASHALKDGGRLHRIGSQVVYEHRSRLEKSLQKERLEHKKAKEDFLVYKLEAQETLNKGRQDSNSRYSALNVQHQMLKSQHEELKKQHSDLEEEHRRQGEDFSRTFNDHKQRYLQLQQEKEQELSKLKESVYNLREENRQLRRAHQDMHTQLQDVKQQHKNLLSEHEQLVVTLEDHKSALAAAQTQVAEYKQLKDTLNRIPSFRKPERTEQQNITQVAHSPQGDSATRDKLPGEPREVSRNSEVWQNHEAVPGRTEETEPYPPTQKEAGFQAPAELTRREAGREEPEGRPVEEEHRRALEEEAMEQVGQAEHLAEEHDPSLEEQRHREWAERRERKEARLLEGQARAGVYPSGKPVAKFQSPYEEQQRLAVRRVEEAQRPKERHEAPPQQRLQGPLPHQHQPQLLARETAQQRQAGLAEGRPQRPEQTRQQARYDAVDNDVVQGAEDQGVQEEEGGAYERDNQHQDEAEEDPENGHELQEQGPHEADPESEAGRAAVEDINPADDPNNQGEDEFEEAGQVREENLPDENEEQKQSHQKQGNAEMEEHLVMAGNPDQQEDNVDDQYQEEGEEEVQEDLTEEKKRELEHNAEETYGENDENADEKNNDGEEQEVRDDNHPKGREEHYEEEEEEEEDGAAAAEKSRQRAEM